MSFDLTSKWRNRFRAEAKCSKKRKQMSHARRICLFPDVFFFKKDETISSTLTTVTLCDSEVKCVMS